MKFYEWMMHPQLGNMGQPSFLAWQCVARIMDEGGLCGRQKGSPFYVLCPISRCRYSTRQRIEESVVVTDRRGSGRTYGVTGDR